MTEIEEKTVRYFDSILNLIRGTDLDKRFFEWMKTQVYEVTLTSVYSLFHRNELSKMTSTLAPKVKGCYDFSFKAVFYNSAIKSVLGYKIYKDIFVPHAINKITIDNKVYYFDVISEIVNKEEIPNITFVALRDFSADEILYFQGKTAFADRLPFVWYQKNIYPKKIVRP